MDKENYRQLMEAFCFFWFMLLVMAGLSFWAGRCTMVPTLDIKPVIQVDVPKVQPTIAVNVPQQPPPVVTVNVPEPSPTPVTVDNKLNIPEPTPPIINVVVGEKGDVKVESPAPRKPASRTEVKLPNVEERDPDGRLLPPPKDAHP